MPIIAETMDKDSFGKPYGVTEQDVAAIKSNPKYSVGKLSEGVETLAYIHSEIEGQHDSDTFVASLAKGSTYRLDIRIDDYRRLSAEATAYIFSDDPAASDVSRRIMHLPAAEVAFSNGKDNTVEFEADRSGDYYVGINLYAQMHAITEDMTRIFIPNEYEYGVTLIEVMAAAPKPTPTPAPAPVPPKPAPQPVVQPPMDVTGDHGPNRLVGTPGNDVLDALRGDDVLNGGKGADLLLGGEGDDRYIVDDRGDRVHETRDGGVDTVFSTVSHWMTANIENLKLIGSKALAGVGQSDANDISGNELNNILKGNGGRDTLKGWGGDDRLDGGTSADRMFGGKGHDRYIVDDADDKVIEAPGSGIDTVVASTDYQLGGHVENLILRGDTKMNGSGNFQNNEIVGNDEFNVLRGLPGHDTLIGWGGHDVLDGGWGADKMFGGKGNDDYYVDNPGDKVIESPATGIDGVVSSINYTLASSLEHLTLIGRNDINGTGNWKDNSIQGNDANNVLVGLQGDDYLSGLFGSDTLSGGGGNDTIIGTYGRDVLIAGAGDDFLQGGFHADRFVFDGNDGLNNVVDDFQQGLDKIVITSGAEKFSDLIDHRLSGSFVRFGNTEIDVDFDYDGDIVPELRADDFLFV